MPTGGPPPPLRSCALTTTRPAAHGAVYTYDASSNGKHFNMATPPKRPASQNAKEGRPRSLPGLGLVEFPSPASAVPSKNEIRAIAKRNMMALFGQ